MPSNELLGCLQEIVPEVVWAPFSEMPEPFRHPGGTVPDVGSSDRRPGYPKEEGVGLDAVEIVMRTEALGFSAQRAVALAMFEYGDRPASLDANIR